MLRIIIKNNEIRITINYRHLISNIEVSQYFNMCFNFLAAILILAYKTNFLKDAKVTPCRLFIMIGL